MLQRLAETNPQLLQQINANPEAFIQSMLAGEESEEHNEGEVQIEITPTENEAINRVLLI